MAQMTDSSPFPAEGGPNGTVNGHLDEDVQMGGDGTAGNNQAAFTANGEQTFVTVSATLISPSAADTLKDTAPAPTQAPQPDGQTYPLQGPPPEAPPVNGVTEAAPTPNPSATPSAYTTTSAAPLPHPPPAFPQAQSQTQAQQQLPPYRQQSHPSPAPSHPPSATFPTSASSAQMPASTRSSAPDPSNSTSTPTPTTKPEPPSGHAIPSTLPSGSPARVYLNTKVTPVLMEGMKYLAKHEPERPLEWLSGFLGERSRMLEGTGVKGEGGGEGGGR